MIKIPSVYVIILNYNHIDDLKETVCSFLRQDYPRQNLVVSDNGSSDGSCEWLKTYHPEITILENNDNLGWAEGNNVGIQYAVEQNADYILLANNDLSFDNPKIISQLIREIQGNDKLIIGPKQFFFEQPEKLHAEGHFFMNVEHKPFNRLRLEYIQNNQLPSYLKVVDYVPGSFVLFHSNLIKDIGYIENQFYLYGEDADFFLRAWKKSYISMVDTRLSILHKVSATSVRGSVLKNYYQSRNIWWNLQRHKDIGINRAYFKKKAYLSLSKSMIKHLISFKIKHVLIVVMGFWHGAIVKKYGKSNFK